MRSRLTVIRRFDTARHALALKGHGGDRGAKGLLPLLVQNLGYIEPHLLADAVRQSALHACGKAGPEPLPVLVELDRKDPWQFHANVLTAMALIAPEKPEVQAILKNAVDDSSPEIHRRPDGLGAFCRGEKRGGHRIVRGRPQGAAAQGRYENINDIGIAGLH